MPFYVPCFISLDIKLDTLKFKFLTMSGTGGRAGPPISEIPFENLPNSRLPNQQNKKHGHRQNC